MRQREINLSQLRHFRHIKRWTNFCVCHLHNKKKRQNSSLKRKYSVFFSAVIDHRKLFVCVSMLSWLPAYSVYNKRPRPHQIVHFPWVQWNFVSVRRRRHKKKCEKIVPTTFDKNRRITVKRMSQKKFLFFSRFHCASNRIFAFSTSFVLFFFSLITKSILLLFVDVTSSSFIMHIPRTMR